jgi:hypothetical protein
MSLQRQRRSTLISQSIQLTYVLIVIVASTISKNLQLFRLIQTVNAQYGNDDDDGACQLVVLLPFTSRSVSKKITGIYARCNLFLLMLCMLTS